MGEALGVADRLRSAIRNRRVAAVNGLSAGRSRALADEVGQGSPSPTVIAEVASAAEGSDPVQLELILSVSRQLIASDEPQDLDLFLETLASRGAPASLPLIEIAKILSAAGDSRAIEIAAKAVYLDPSCEPVTCEAAAIALLHSGPVAALRALLPHLDQTDTSELSQEVRRHAGWAMAELEGDEFDWSRLKPLAKAAAGTRFATLRAKGSPHQLWSATVLLLESDGGSLTAEEAELLFGALSAGRRRLAGVGSAPRLPLADLLRISSSLGPTAVSRLVRLLTEAGRTGEAVSAASRLRDTPYEFEALLAQAAHAPDRWEARVLPRWLAVTEKFRHDSKAQFLSGRVLIQRGEVERALVALGRAHDLDPDNAEYALALGGAYERIGDWATALQVYERTDALSPGRAALMRKRASMLMELGVPEQAVDLLSPALAGDAPDPETLVVLVWALERAGRPAEAARLLVAAQVAADAPLLLRETALRVLAGEVLRTGRAYADHRQLEEALRLAHASVEDMPEVRLAEVLQAALEIGEDHVALALLAACAVANRADPVRAEADTFAALLHRLSKVSLQGDLTRFGHEASAEAFQTVGMALELQGRRPAAALAMTVAALKAPDNEGLALAAGTLLVRHDHLAAAEAMFALCNRAYEDSCRNFIWPRSDAGRWPKGGGPTPGAFDALLPEGATWPRITVVTPSYNQADFVEETVLSVLGQQYPNLQYIIVDGGSTDGAAEILERYRDQVDVLIIEPDKGQTDAINKGFALADGELMTWLNSDDMFAPGALHRIALEYLNSKADIIAGICVAYRDGRVEVANLPAVRQETFTVEVMADIFRYWMKGYFFYQPEVVFSRAVWEKTGGRLNDDLNYTMDYEFWMRCAQAEARFEVVHWPIALFRQHEAQKTSRLLHCVDEQAVVRDEIKQIAPSEERLRALLTGARERLRGERVKVAVYTSRYDKIFSPLMEAELALRFQDSGMSVRLFTSPDELPLDDDFIVWLVHLQGDDYAIDAYRQRGGKAQIIGWFWDNHHHLFPNRDVVERLDYWSAGHAFVSHYLANDQALRLEPTPLCVSQWSRQEAEVFYRETRNGERSDTLYGGFVRYAFAEKRNALIQGLMESGEEGVYFLEESDTRRYFDRSRRSRFAEWASHKASLCLPLDGDLSQRLFDALLTGQVPIAPKDIADLDAVIPPALQKKLPIVRFDKYKPADVKAAHAKAIKLFDEGGPEAALARHKMAVEAHMFSDRIAALLDHVRAFADGR